MLTSVSAKKSCFLTVYLLSSSFENFHKRRDLVYTVSIDFGPYQRAAHVFDPDALPLMFSDSLSLAC